MWDRQIQNLIIISESIILERRKHHTTAILNSQKKGKRKQEDKDTLTIEETCACMIFTIILAKIV